MDKTSNSRAFDNQSHLGHEKSVRHLFVDLCSNLEPFSPLHKLSVEGDAVTREKTSVQSAVEEEDLDHEQLSDILQRLEDLNDIAGCSSQLVHTSCACETSPQDLSREKANVYSDDGEDSSSDESSSENSDEEDFTLSQLLKMLKVYAEKGVHVQHASNVIKNLANSYHCEEDVTPIDLDKVLEYLHDDSSVAVKEGALLTLKQLCQRVNNAGLLLERGLMGDLLYWLELETMEEAHEAVLLVLEKLVAHYSLSDYWMEIMVTAGFAAILKKLTTENPDHVIHAALGTVSALVKYKNMAILLIDQGMALVMRAKDLSLGTEELFPEILSNLVLHTDHTRAHVLDADALPICVRMIRNGPCGSQKQALLFLQVLCQSSYGLTAFLEDSVIPFVMDSMQESYCRKVREAASRVLVTLTSTKKVPLLRSAFLQLEKYFCCDDSAEEVNSSQAVLPPSRSTTPEPVRQKTETAAKINKAINELAKLTVHLLCREARIEMDGKREVVDILLKPCIDTDPSLVQLVQNHVNVIANLSTLPINRPSMGTSDTMGQNGKDVGDFKKKRRKVNHSVVKVLVSCGALCLIDLLYVYTFKLLESQSLPGMNRKSENRPIQGKSPIWQDRAKSKNTPPGKKCAQGHDKTASPHFKIRCSYEDIFEKSERQLIISLLCALKHFSVCSSTSCFNSIEEEIKLKMLNHKLKSKAKAKDITDRNLVRNIGAEYPHEAWGPGTSDRPSSRGPTGRPLTPQQAADIFGKVKEKSKDSKRKTQRPSTADKVWDPKNPFLSCTLHRDPIVTLEQEYNDRIKKEMDSLRLSTRKTMYIGGCVEAVGPWLVVNDADILDPVVDVLRYLIQPLDEKHLPHPPADKKTNKMSRPRPVSATTSKDQEVVLNKALGQMSKKMAEMVREALGPRVTYSPLSHLTKTPAGLRPSSAKAVMMTETPKSKPVPAEPTSWKPSFDPSLSVVQQCRRGLVFKNGSFIVQGLTSRHKTVRKACVFFLKDLIELEDTWILMHLSHLGLMKKMVDFLRINDDDELLEVMGLIVSRMLVTSDDRLSQLFDTHGGPTLLMSMARRTTGLLRQEVGDTLKTVTHGLKKQKHKQLLKNAQEQKPDIWEQVSQKWQAQDRVTQIFRRPFVP